MSRSSSSVGQSSLSSARGALPSILEADESAESDLWVSAGRYAPVVNDRAQDFFNAVKDTENDELGTEYSSAEEVQGDNGCGSPDAMEISSESDSESIAHSNRDFSKSRHASAQSHRRGRPKKVVQPVLTSCGAGNLADTHDPATCGKQIL